MRNIALLRLFATAALVTPVGTAAAHVAATGMAAPHETLPILRDGFAVLQLTELDLSAAGINTVIWATSSLCAECHNATRPHQ